MESAKLADLTAIRRFITGGAAVFTLVSLKTGERKTFKVEAAKDKVGFYFVSLLTGSDNQSDYTYLCCLWLWMDESLGVKLNRQGWGTEAFQAFAWLVGRCNDWHANLNLRTPDELRERLSSFAGQCEVWHEGTCCRCGRPLTTPESIAAGIGPVCAEKGMS